MDTRVVNDTVGFITRFESSVVDVDRHATNADASSLGSGVVPSDGGKIISHRAQRTRARNAL
jgi:hypothetical protein